VLIKTALSYDDVLLIPKHSYVESRSKVNLQTKLTPKISLDIPIISANMDSVTNEVTATSLSKLGGISILPRFNSIQEQFQMLEQVKKEGARVGVAVGVKGDYLERTEKLISLSPELIVIDVAHGHLNKVGEVVAEIKNRYPNHDLVAGNVATYEGAIFLLKNGADVIKVGVGPGSICTTRVETGHGVPQFTAVTDVAKAVRMYHKTLIADGGVKSCGDIVKALAGGASAVMLGNFITGTDETPGEIYEFNNKKFKKYFGSTSVEQKSKHIENLAKDPNYLKHIEGVSGFVSYKGSLKDLIERCKGSLTSGFSYSGANNLEELWQKAEFIQITQAGYTESKHHDIFQTELL